MKSELALFLLFLRFLSIAGFSIEMKSVTTCVVCQQSEYALFCDADEYVVPLIGTAYALEDEKDALINMCQQGIDCSSGLPTCCGANDTAQTCTGALTSLPIDPQFCTAASACSFTAEYTQPIVCPSRVVVMPTAIKIDFYCIKEAHHVVWLSNDELTAPYVLLFNKNMPALVTVDHDIVCSIESPCGTTMDIASILLLLYITAYNCFTELRIEQIGKDDHIFDCTTPKQFLGFNKMMETSDNFARMVIHPVRKGNSVVVYLAVSVTTNDGNITVKCGDNALKTKSNICSDEITTTTLLGVTTTSSSNDDILLISLISFGVILCILATFIAVYIIHKKNKGRNKRSKTTRVRRIAIKSKKNDKDYK